MDAFDGEPMPLFAQVSAGFSPNLKKAVDEKAFTELQKQVKQKFGTMKEAKFFTFQRFDQADRVTFIASFTKEKIVSMIFAFDKQNKLVDFAFTPVKQPEAKAAKWYNVTFESLLSFLREGFFVAAATLFVKWIWFIYLKVVKL